MHQETMDYLTRVVNGLARAASMVHHDTETTLAEGNTRDLVQHFVDLRNVNEMIKDAREALTKIEDVVSRERIPALFKAEGIKTAKYEGIGRVTVAYRFSCSMLDKDGGIKWLEDNGYEGLVQKTVNSSSLGAFARNMLEEEGKELPEDIFKTSSSPYTSVTKG